jgi:hypothetical protein
MFKMNYLFLFALIIVIRISIINSYDFTPSCATCKHYVSYTTKHEFGLCNIFKNKIYIKDKEILIKNFASHCRRDESLCGKYGYLYECSDKHKAMYKYIYSMGCDDMVEHKTAKELSNMDKELKDIFKKMAKHNKKK